MRPYSTSMSTIYSKQQHETYLQLDCGLAEPNAPARHWIRNFIPNNQFSFVKSISTGDYGAALACTIQLQLDNKGEGILVSLDVDGAFDKLWWARSKRGLQAYPKLKA